MIESQINWKALHKKLEQLFNQVAHYSNSGTSDNRTSLTMLTLSSSF